MYGDHVMYVCGKGVQSITADPCTVAKVTYNECTNTTDHNSCVAVDTMCMCVRGGGLVGVGGVEG